MGERSLHTREVAGSKPAAPIEDLGPREGAVLVAGPPAWNTGGVLPAVDETFLETAPTRLADTFVVDLPASTVWAELTRDGTLDWCRAAARCGAGPVRP